MGTKDKQSFEIQQPQKPKEKIDLKIFTWFPYEKYIVSFWFIYTILKITIDFAFYNFGNNFFFEFFFLSK